MPGEIDIDESGFIAGDTAKLAHSVGLDPSNMDGAQSPVECLPDGGTKCCCGRSSCAWLRHSNELVEDLERDVKTAGRLGQVCGVFRCCCFGRRAVSLSSIGGDGERTMMLRPRGKDSERIEKPRKLGDVTKWRD